MNRIERAIEKYGATLAKASTTDLKRIQDKVDDTSATELARFQELKSLAQANGLLTQEEAQTVYELLGKETPTVEAWRKLPVPTKAMLTHLMWELMCSMRVEAGPIKRRGKR